MNKKQTMLMQQSEITSSIADNAITKQNQNYTDASPNKKDAYNNAVTTAQGIIDQKLQTLH